VANSNPIADCDRVGGLVFATCAKFRKRFVLPEREPTMSIIRSLKARVIICEKEEGTGAISPIDQNGTYPLSDEWEAIKGEIDAFYTMFPDSEIKKHNREVKEHNQKIVDEHNQGMANFEFSPTPKERKKERFCIPTPPRRLIQNRDGSKALETANANQS
jgi:hypothetical protein